MNAEKESEVDTMSRCASCGVKAGEGDNKKLKICTACYLVKYCGVKCQKDHRKKHKRACKQRAAELRDEKLFKQPESSFLGDCPICMLTLPLDARKSSLWTCCSKVICIGCDYANQMREIQEKQDPKCPFCRQPIANSETEAKKKLKDRAEMNDPVAMHQLGIKCREAGDHQSAFEYFSKAAELGDVGSHHELGVSYHNGEGVEKDESKEVYHDEQAAMGGHPEARHHLGYIEWKNGRHERAVKHWIIAAKLGFDDSLEALKIFFKNGLVSKDDLTTALRGHQTAVDATKSPDRDAGEAARMSPLV